MTPRERVLAALRCEVPDRVPRCEFGIDRPLAQQIMGWPGPAGANASEEQNLYTVDEMKALAAVLKLDNINCALRAPVYASKHPGKDGRLFYGEGMLKTSADLAMLRLPDPGDDALYAEAERFAANRGDYALGLSTRAGIFPTMLGLGLEAFGIALFEDRPLVEAVLDCYFDWCAAVVARICSLGFDFIVTTDDMAFKTAPFFSPALFREVVMPRYRRLAEAITVPWIIHSDGNILPFLDDLLTLGIAGLNPIEAGAMDIRALKQKYGKRLCLIGNVDLNILGLGTPADVAREVRALIRDVGPGGGYMVASGNSLTSYVRPENALALGEATLRHGRYPLGA
jgi:uroporphyrinogen decarboxylase